MLNIGEVIDIYFREKRFKAIVVNLLANSKYEVVYENIDIPPNLGRYVINEVEYTINGWTLINPSSKIATRDNYSVFIDKL